MLLQYAFLTVTFVAISIYGCLYFVSEGEGKSVLKFCLTTTIVYFHPRYICNIVDKVTANPLYSHNSLDD